jgi:hypothetical protein
MNKIRTHLILIFKNPEYLRIFLSHNRALICTFLS